MPVRSILLVASLTSLAGCMGPVDPGYQTARDQQRLAGFIGDRSAGTPTRCISAYPGMQIQAVGDKIVARWGGRLWVNQVQGSCRQADSMNAFLVTERDTAGQYCENQTWRVVSNSGGMTMGSCMLGPWVPYGG